MPLLFLHPTCLLKNHSASLESRIARYVRADCKIVANLEEIHAHLHELQLSYLPAETCASNEVLLVFVVEEQSSVIVMLREILR